MSKYTTSKFDSFYVYRIITYLRLIKRFVGLRYITLNFYIYVLISNKKKLFKFYSGTSLLFESDGIMHKLYFQSATLLNFYNKSLTLFQILYPNLYDSLVIPEIHKFNGIFVSRSKVVNSRECCLRDGLILLQKFTQYNSILKIDERSRFFVLRGLELIKYFDFNDYKINSIKNKIDLFLDIDFHIGPIHGDFHLGNIVIDKNGGPYLIDNLDLAIIGVQDFDLLQLLFQYYATSQKIRWIDSFENYYYINFIKFLNSSLPSEEIPIIQNLEPKILIYALHRLGYESTNFGNRYDLPTISLLFDKILDS